MKYTAGRNQKGQKTAGRNQRGGRRLQEGTTMEEEDCREEPERRKRGAEG